MKIRDVATMAGVSHQAVYKRLKARGIRPESITDKGTGELTAEGLAIMFEMYPQTKDTQPATASPQPPTGSETVETLRSEVQRLSNALSNAEARIVALTEERDFLRGALTHSQEMEALRARIDVLEAGQRANAAQALTDGSGGGDPPRRGLLSWLRGRGRGTGER